MELIKRLWRGDIPLHITYWGYGVIASVVFRLINLAVEKYYLQIIGSASGEIFLYGLTALNFIYFPFIYVAIWRSATKYTGDKSWAVVARIMVVIGVLIQARYGYMLYTSNDITQENLANTASLLNKALPMMVDEVTELTRLSSGKDSLTYHYKTTNMASEDVSKSSFYHTVAAHVARDACNDKGMRALLGDGLTINFEYVGSDNMHIASVTVSNEDCEP